MIGLLIAVLLLVIVAVSAYFVWPKVEDPNRCDCGHRRTTHRVAEPSYCLRVDCDCREFRPA